ncbi:LysR family transcriptional regulator [Bradyrhizobium sp. 168]|uniref:LysR family transcriptional regulator n=1 Tax=Bradyrhizobium sp. 168 TaxID=2782639 RepID=UPI001FFA1647|nr:LysR family transcriptional regulator [Bradyrhizobium sp. 168]
MNLLDRSDRVYLRAYLAVARTLSFTRAAAETNLSQPALTVQIRTLKEQLGIKLFDRNSRSVELTRLGRELVPAFQRILREFDETVTGVRDIARHSGGSVYCRRLRRAYCRTLLYVSASAFHAWP